MSRFLKTLLFATLLAGSTPALAQEQSQSSQNYLQQADGFFRQGDYNRARGHYIAAEGQGHQVADKLKNAERCLGYLKLGNEAFMRQQYAEAKSNFEKILQINPADPKMADRIKSCDEMMRRSLASERVGKAKVRRSLFADRGYKDNYLAWGILDAGYPLRAGSSFVGRHGGKLGIGYHVSVGADFGGKSTYANTIDAQYYSFDGNYNKFITTIHYGVGLRLYYNALFLSVGYGTLGSEKVSAHNSNNGRWNTEGWRQGKGIPVLIGFDVIPGSVSRRSSKLFLSFSGGVALDTFAKEWKPMLNAKVGLAWGM